MAYDEELAARVRDHLAAEPELTEKRMFGGLAFLLDGKMAVAISGRGGLMVRVDPDRTQELIDTTDAGPMVMRDRPVRGWVLVAVEDVRTERRLEAWVDRGTARARDAD